MRLGTLLDKTNSSMYRFKYGIDEFDPQKYIGNLRSCF